MQAQMILNGQTIYCRNIDCDEMRVDQRPSVFHFEYWARMEGWERKELKAASGQAVEVWTCPGCAKNQ